MPLVVVERTFQTPPSDADLKAIAEKQAQCIQIYGVTYRHSALSEDHRRMICQYESADMESVRKVQHEIGAPFDAIWIGKIVS